MVTTPQYIAAGNTIDYTPGSAVAAGTIVKRANMLGIANNDIPANVQGSLTVEGIIEVFVNNTYESTIAVGDLATVDTTADPQEVIAHTGSEPKARVLAVRTEGSDKYAKIRLNTA